MDYKILVIVFSQLLFSASDFMARYNMSRSGFKMSTFLSVWFVAYVAIRSVGTMAQLYVFTSLELGRVATLLAITALLFANLLGILFLKEVLPITAYVGIVLAIMAFVLLSLRT